MNPESSIDRLTDALTSAAHPAEVAAQSAVVTQMAGLAAPTTGVVMIIKTLVGHKVAAVAGALVLGTTTAAAASGNMPFVQDEPEPAEVVEMVAEASADTVVPDSTDGLAEGAVQQIEVASDRIDDAVTEPPVDEAGEAYGDVDCDDASNHGEYVSSVAQDESIEGNRGAIVSQAAKTSCGKGDDDAHEGNESPGVDTDDGDDEATHGSDDHDEEEEETDDSEPNNGRRSGGGHHGDEPGNDNRGNGNGNANDNRGNGNGNGN